MTTDERFERIEHVTAVIAEERRKDRDEYKALWRDTQRQIDRLATETRLRFEELGDKIDNLGDKIDSLATESRAQDKALGERIDQMVSAIGQLIANPPSR